MKKRVSLRLIQLSVAGLLAGFSVSSYASGFQLFEVNGAGTGDFYASGAASKNDASAAFFNPAGLVTMKHQQVQLSAVNIFSDVNFTGTSTRTLIAPLTQSGSAQGGGYSFIPSLEAAGPINDELGWGLSVAVPFGLQTDYDDNSFLRYAATETKVQDIDFSPSIGFKVTSQFSLGFGLDADHLYAKLNSVAGAGPTSGADTQSQNEASGWGYGWHAGALYQFTPATRVGFEYRSKVSYGLSGTSKFIGPLAGGFLENDGLTADTTLPATSILSAVHRFNPEWTGEATVMYTQWSVFDNLVLNNVQSAGTTINVALPQNFRNTWRFALGGTFQPFKQWLFRAGLGYDQTPTVDDARNVRLPDGNRIATALGVHYQVIKTVGVDAGWTHLFFQDGDVNNVQQTGAETVAVNGSAKTSADLVGVQLTWNIA